MESSWSPWYWPWDRKTVAWWMFMDFPCGCVNSLPFGEAASLQSQRRVPLQGHSASSSACQASWAADLSVEFIENKLGWGVVESGYEGGSTNLSLMKLSSQQHFRWNVKTRFFSPIIFSLLTAGCLLRSYSEDLFGSLCIFKMTWKRL